MNHPVGVDVWWKKIKMKKKVVKQLCSIRVQIEKQKEVIFLIEKGYNCNEESS